MPNKSFLKIPLSEVTFHHVFTSQMEKESESSPREGGQRGRQCVQLGLNLI